MIASLLALLLTPSAEASTMALDPQVRAHGGASWVPGPAGLGVTAGFDARMTRFVAMDIGGFASLQDLPAPGDAEGTLPESAVLRHGIYLAPGLRIPHPQPRSWAWEVFVRGGGGVAWATDIAAPVPDELGLSYVTSPGMAGVGGVDTLVRAGKLGGRIAARAWVFEATKVSPAKSFTIVRPQITAEALVQW